MGLKDLFFEKKISNEVDVDVNKYLEEAKKLQEQHANNIDIEFTNKGFHFLCDEVSNLYASQQISEDYNIFLVEKYYSTLPDSLPKDVRKKTLLNILTASNLNISLIQNDANERINALDSWRKDKCVKIENEIKTFDEIIEKAKNEIENAKAKIESLNYDKNCVNYTYNEEISRIEKNIELIS